MDGCSLSVVKLHRKLYCNNFGILGQKESLVKLESKLCKEKLSKEQNNTTEAIGQLMA